MNILITGGAGYKGVLLTSRLLDAGHRVTILDNFMYGYDSVLHLVGNPLISIIKEDIRNLNGPMISGYDTVFHLAGISGYPACEANPHSAKLINVDASRTLCRLLSREQQLIYASTTSFYGKSGEVCTEEAPVEPVSLYGITKYQAEQLFMERENSVALRFATIFGVSARMRCDLLVNDFTYRAINERCVVLFESLTKRTFLHIDDAIAAYAFALHNFRTMRGGVYNVGDDVLNYSKMEIAERVRSATGCAIINSEMQDFDVRNFVISFDKLARLGYRATRTLDDGISEMVKLFGFYRPFSQYKTI